MDDEEKRAHEEEEEQAKKRRQKQAEEQEEEEEAWKAQRQSSRVEVDEGDEDANDENNNNKKDEKNNKNQNDQDESKDENNNQDNNNQDNNRSDSSQNRNSSNGSRNQNNGRNTSSKPSSAQNQNKPTNSAKPKGDQSKAPQGTGANVNNGTRTSNLGARTSANASKSAASSASAGGAKSVSRIGKLIAKLGTGLIVVLILIIVLGIIFFFLTMPGMVVGKIGQAVNSFLTGVANFFNGSNANRRSVNRAQVVNAAKYLDDMGYDLEGYGFLDDEKKDTISAKEDTGFWTKLGNIFDDDGGDDSIDPTEIDIEDFEETDYKERIEKEKQAKRAGNDIKQVVLSKTWEEVKNKDDKEIKKSIILMRGSDGEIEFVKSKYLYMYLIAANTTYLVRNDCVDLEGRLLKFLGSNPEARQNGVGLIYFTYPMSDASGYAPKPKDYISGISDDTDFERPESGIRIFGREVLAFSDRYKVDPKGKKLIIYNSDDGLFKTTFYTYNLGGWISQYGMPLQLSLALHLSTMAPDFAYEVAEHAARETRVEMGLIEIKGVDIKLILRLDLFGNGEVKNYTVDRKIRKYFHTKEDGKEEEGYDSEETANSNENSDYNSLDTDELPKFNSLDEALDDFNERMNIITNNGANKQDLGTLIYAGITSSNGDRHIPSANYIGKQITMVDNEQDFLYSYAVTSTNSHIKELQTIIATYSSDAEISGEKFKMNTDSTKIRAIVKRHFKVNDLKKAVWEDSDVCDKDGNSISYYKRNGKSWEDFNDEDRNMDYYYVKTQDCGKIGGDNNYENAIAIANDDSWYIEIPNVYKDNWNQNNELTYQCGNSAFKESVFYKGSLDDWYNIIFLGDEPKEYESIWQKIWNAIKKFIGPRIYYRLLEEGDENKPVKELTKNHGFSDYCYVTNERSYYKNDEGWFWRKSIPIELYNAVKRTESEYNATQEAMKSSTYREGQEVFSNWVDVQKGHGTSISKSDAEDIMNILNVGYKMNTEDFTKYVPLVLNVTNHWFEDLDYDAIEGSEDGQKAPCYKFDNSENIESTYVYTAIDTDTNAVKKASKAEILYIQEKAPGKITQEHKPKSKNRGKYLDDLLKKDYYIYDGYGRSKEKKKIDFKNISVDAIAMLEQIQGEDAQQIIRMFKIYMATHGVEFEATAATAYKKEICSKILSKEDWDCEQHLLVENNSSYVLRADIPPSQYGFPVSTKDKMIYALAPVNGEVVYRSDDNVCIKISDTTKHQMDKQGKVIKSVKDWTLLISGIAVHDDIIEGKQVKVGDHIGHTVRRDIKMVLRDENGAIVENTYNTTVDGETKDTSPIEYDEHQGNVTKEVNGYRTADDIYYVVQNNGLFSPEEKARIGGANGEMIQALVEMEQTYGIDPLWALAVAHWESNCGTAYKGEHRIFNIKTWSKIKGNNGESKGFATYSTDRDAIMDFGNYAANCYDRLLSTVDDFEEYNGTQNGAKVSLKLFEGAKKKDYPTYLQLKTVLSSKGV